MRTVRVSVPGKIMLAGEYSILQGHPALAVTIDQRMEVWASKSGPAEGIRCFSDIWERPILVRQTPQNDEDIPQSDILYETVSEAMKRFHVKNGTIRINSGLKVTHGVGSSSAVRLGTMLALAQLQNEDNVLSDLDQVDRKTAGWELVRNAFELQKRYQTRASGYDFATQFVGGLIYMQADQNTPWPGFLRKNSEQVCLDKLNLFVHVFVGGEGAPTKKVMRNTLDWLGKAGIGDKLNQESNRLISEFEGFLKDPHDSIAELLSAVGEHRRLMENFPDYPKKLARSLAKCPGCDEKWSFKTTGAGGEDAILVFGDRPEIEEPAAVLRGWGWKQLNVKFADKGTTIETREVPYDA